MSASDHFDRRIYTPERLMADLRYLIENSEQVRDAMRSGRVSKAFSKRIMLAVTGVNGCRYCSYAHVRTALSTGVPEDEARRILDGELSEAPPEELPALLFAQHYAETGGQPDPETVEELFATYGGPKARDILVHIRMITMGNLSGNTFDALLSRFAGRPAEGSSFLGEILTMALLAGTPFVGALAMLRSSLRRLTLSEYTLPAGEAEAKVLVYGAGVLGSLYAARLAQSGQDVTLLARGAHAVSLRKQGIQLHDLATGARTAVPIKVAEELGAEDRYDLIIVLLPKDHVAEALPSLAANPHVPSILFMGNNVAGPGELIRAVGRSRVVLGFPGAGGTREGDVIHYVDASNGDRWPVTLGELDGLMSARLLRIAAIFRRAGIPSHFEANMDAWLKTHAAVILPIAGALYMADCDPFRLARTRDGLVILARAMREALQVLDILGIPIIPAYLRAVLLLPEPLAVSILRGRLQGRLAQFTLAHARSSRSEMAHLDMEFSTLASDANFATPMMDYLAAHISPEVPPLADGSAQLGVNWRDVWIALGGLASVVGLGAAIHRLTRRPSDD